MIDLPLAVLGGILGSSHCVGMCGAFVLSVGMGARPGRNLIRQFVYAGGRVFTYAFLGFCAAFAGLWFGRKSGALAEAQGVLSLAAGAFLIVQGLAALGVPPPWRRRRTGGAGSAACLAGSFARPFLMSPRLESVFAAGVLNGFLPCGLVYGYLALASSTASFALGPVLMAAFGLGTVPVMVLTGLGASALSLAARRRLFRVAGICVVATGLLAVGRGWTALSRAGDGDGPSCPACESREEPSFRILGRITAGGG